MQKSQCCNEIMSWNGNCCQCGKYYKELDNSPSAKTNMTELEKLKEEGDKEFDNKIEELSKLGEPKTNDDANRYYHEIKLFIHERERKSFTLGTMKGVELVEGVVPRKEETSYPKYDGTDTPEDFRNTDGKLVQGWNECRSEILSNITNLKQELK